MDNINKKSLLVRVKESLERQSRTPASRLDWIVLLVCGVAGIVVSYFIR
jgi:hypothetical protein